MYLAENQLENYLKYNTFHQEQTKKYQADKFKAAHLPYDEVHHRFSCPNGQFLVYQATRPYTTDNGYQGKYDIYECQDCSQCQLIPDCTRAQGNRRIQVNWNLRRLKAQARENLNSETGRALRSQRGEDVEAVFGHVKQNRHFRRFLLRGLEKVTTEWGLLSIASNMLKLAAVS